METTSSYTGEYILTVNAGSSSVKIALFTQPEITKVFEVAVEGIGIGLTRFVMRDDKEAVVADNHVEAVKILIDRISKQVEMSSISTVTHRIVFGGQKYRQTIVVSKEILTDLHELEYLDPAHLSVELELVEVFQKLFPRSQAVLSFDTAFHCSLPTRARLLAIPRRFEEKGLFRYGFHGLSYAYVYEDLRHVEGEAVANGKVIIAHLGNGVSLAALQDGRSIDTTMSVTPASGIPMSTRSGDLDPSLVKQLARIEGYDLERFDHMINFESGILGVSETSADMEKLLEIENEDQRAKDAVDLFCYQVKKSIGGFAAALGGLDTLVFTGGMGENAPKIRSRVCDGLEFLGIGIDADRNQKGARLISVDGSRLNVFVIHTDEAVTMARETILLIRN